MRERSASTPGIVRLLHRPITNVLEWGDVDRVRLMLALTLPFVVVYLWRSWYLIDHPAVEPYYDRRALQWMRAMLVVAAVFWLAFLAWGRFEKRRPGTHVAYVTTGNVAWWLAWSAGCYGAGPVTSPMALLILFGGVFNLLLLPARIAVLGITLGTTLVVGSLLAVGEGLLPYAPLLGVSPMTDAQMARPYLIGNTLATLGATFVALVTIAYVLTQWRAQAEALRAAHAHLEEANQRLERRVEERTAELLDAERQLEDARRLEAIGRLAGGIAHDFNNLLAVISGYSELLLRRAGEEKQRHDLRQVLAASERGARLVEQLLAFGRRQLVELRPLRLNDVVTGIETMLGRLLGEHVAVRLRLAPALGLVEADTAQMEQVILNLATNARDAMPAGGTLTIESANLEVAAPTTYGSGSLAPGSYVTLRVTDTGCGMAPDVQRSAMEPFFTTKDPGRGTGLGLSTVHGIVSQCGGVLSVTSRPGEGVSVCVVLPRVADAAARGEPAASPAGALRPVTVAVVEDDPALRELLCRALEGEGHVVLRATDGDEALRIARAHGGVIDVLLTDVVLPGVNGREVAERFREFHPRVRVVFMSGYTDDEVLRRGISTHEVAVLRKPFSTTALSDALRDALARRPRAVGDPGG